MRVLLYRNTSGSGLGDVIRNLFIMYINDPNIKFNCKDSTLDDIFESYDINASDEIIIDMQYYRNYEMKPIKEEERMAFIDHLKTIMKPLIKNVFIDMLNLKKDNNKTLIHIRTGDQSFIQGGDERLDEMYAFEKLNLFVKENKINDYIVVTDSYKLKILIGNSKVTDIIPTHTCYNKCIINTVMEWLYIFSFNKVYQFCSRDNRTSQFSNTAALIGNGHINLINSISTDIVKRVDCFIDKI